MVKKVIAGIIICCSLGIFSIATSLLLIDYAAVYQDFLANTKITNLPQNVSRIKIVNFPIPHLVIDNVNEPDKFKLQKLEIHFSLWSLLSFKPKATSIQIEKVDINHPVSKLNLMNHPQLVTKLIDARFNINIAALSLLDEENKPSVVAQDVLLTQEGSTKRFSGKISGGTNFQGSINTENDTTNFHYSLTNNDYEVKLVETYQDKQLKNGKVNCRINNVNSFLAFALPEFKLVLDKMHFREKVNVSFDLLSIADSTKIDNIVIDSPSIAGMGSMIVSNNNDRTNSNIKLNFTKIDLRTSPVSFSLRAHPTLQAGYTNNHYDNDRKMQMDIVIEQIIISDNNELEKVKLSANLINGIISVEELSAQIDSQGIFKLTGKLAQEQENHQPIFNGKLNLEYADFNLILSLIGYSNLTTEQELPFSLSSTLTITPLAISLTELLFNANNTQIEGNIANRYNEAVPTIKGNLNFSEINLNLFPCPIISPAINFAKNLAENMQDKDYLNKFIAIRQIPQLTELDVNFNNLTYQDLLLKKLKFKLAISPGKIQIDNLNFINDDNFLIGSVKLLATDLNPQLTITVDDGYWQVNFLSPTSLLHLKEKLLTELSLAKVFFTLKCLSLTLQQEELLLNKLKFLLFNDNNILKISDLSADIFSGTLQGSGNIILEPYTINLAYALNSIDLSTIPQSSLSQFLPNAGLASLNGVITTKGNSLEELLYNLYTDSTFIAKGVRINNFSIDDFIERINASNYPLENLDTDLDRALTSGITNILNSTAKMQLSKGDFRLQDMIIQTKRASASLASTFNIYDFKLNLLSLFSFYIATNNFSPANKPITLGINAKGTIFNPQKTADAKMLKQFFSIPNQPLTSQ